MGQDLGTVREQMTDRAFVDATPALDMTGMGLIIWMKIAYDGGMIAEVYVVNGSVTERLGGMVYPVNSGCWHLEAVCQGGTKHGLSSDGFKVGLQWVMDETGVLV